MFVIRNFLMTLYSKDRGIPHTKIAILISLCVIGILFIIIQSTVITKNVKKSMNPVFVNDANFQNPISLFLDTKDYIFKVNKRFLSFSIDSSQIWQPLTNPYLSDRHVIQIVSHLRGGYLRLGGTVADKIYFKPSYNNFLSLPLPIDGEHCPTEKYFCLDFLQNITAQVNLSAHNWIELNEFSIATGLKMLFDLNSLLRDSDMNSPWDSRNAELLMDYSFARGYRIDWELGNEPDRYKNAFGIEISPSRLAKDYTILRNLVNKYTLFKDSVLVGPGVTNPHISWQSKPHPSIFLKEFLTSGADVDAVSWHHYYTGPNATEEDFLDPDLYDSFRKSCERIQNITKKSGYSSKQVWIGETGSAYGGGVVDLSGSFVTSLLWLDKLGIAAQSGISVIVRQSLFKGNYKLIDPIFLKPFPDYWVCILHKKLVGRKVLKPNVKNGKNDPMFRVYMQCSTEKAYPVFLGVNLGNYTQGIVFPHSEKLKASYYSMSGYPSVTSTKVTLNGEPLNLTPTGDLPPLNPIYVSTSIPILIPSHSIFFLVVHYNVSACE